MNSGDITNQRKKMKNENKKYMFNKNMPFRRKYASRRPVFRRRRFTSRRFGKRRFNKRMDRATKTIVRQPAAIVSDRHFCKLYQPLTVRYIGSGAGALVSVNLQGNGFGIAGEEAVQFPAGLLELSNLFERYVIYGTKVKVEIDNESNTGGLRALLVPLNEQSALLTDYQSCLSNPYARDKIMGPSTGQNKAILKNYMTTTRMWGLKKGQVKTEDDFSGDTTDSGSLPGGMSDPVNTWWWNLLFEPTLASDTVNACVTIKVTTYVEFYNRRPLSTTKPLGPTGPAM